MARSDDDEDKVGYGKPPRKHQFRAGVSGNPSGRPRGSRNQVVRKSLNPFLDAFLRETDRVVNLREGDGTIELSVFEASVRKLGLKAIQGDHRALKLMIEQRRLADEARFEELTDQIQTVERYKAEWGPKFQRAKELGLPEPKQLPHPDHVHICRETCMIKFTGPDDAELKAYWDKMKQSLRFMDRRLKEARVEAEGSPRSKNKAETLKSLEEVFRKLVKQVPKGWNWREEIGDYQPKF
jgi:hypothetical protein